MSLENVWEYKELYANDFDKNHIMLFASPFDTKLLFNTCTGDDYGKLYVHSVPLLSIENPYSYYDSLKKMLETTVKIYESGAFVYDKENDMLDSDAKIAREITRSLNLRSNYWQNKFQ